MAGSPVVERKGDDLATQSRPYAATVPRTHRPCARAGSARGGGDGRGRAPAAAAIGRGRPRASPGAPAPPPGSPARASTARRVEARHHPPAAPGVPQATRDHRHLERLGLRLRSGELPRIAPQRKGEARDGGDVAARRVEGRRQRLAPATPLQQVPGNAGGPGAEHITRMVHAMVRKQDHRTGQRDAGGGDRREQARRRLRVRPRHGPTGRESCRREAPRSRDRAAMRGCRGPAGPPSGRIPAPRRARWRPSLPPHAPPALRPAGDLSNADGARRARPPRSRAVPGRNRRSPRTCPATPPRRRRRCCRLRPRRPRP